MLGEQRKQEAKSNARRFFKRKYQMLGIENGKPVPKAAPRVLPYVRIFCDPATASADNPNGIQVDTNMASAQRPNWQYMVMKLILDGGMRWTDFLEKKGGEKLSETGLVLPDGTPAPLPQEAPDAQPAT